MERDIESALTKQDRQLVLQSSLEKVDQWFDTQFAKWVFIGISFNGSSRKSSKEEFPVEARILHSLQNDSTSYDRFFAEVRPILEKVYLDEFFVLLCSKLNEKFTGLQKIVLLVDELMAFTEYSEEK
jgi:hypothetical protein